MRVYLPATLAGLAAAAAGGGFPAEAGDPAPVRGHAVTPAVREWYTEGDLEELEYAAMLDAAEASLHLLADDPDAPRKRVVVAAEVDDRAVTPVGHPRSAVAVTGRVRLQDVVSVHVDEDAAVPAVTAAIGALAAAADGDDDAQFLVDEADARDLLWYDVSEVSDLL